MSTQRSASPKLIHCCEAFALVFGTALLLLFKVVANKFVMHHLGFEGISTCFRFLYFNALCKASSCTSAQFRYCFLCHCSLLFNLSVDSYLFKVWVVFLTLQSVRSVSFVLCCDVAGHSRYTALFLLSALKDHLNAVTFVSCHCTVGLLKIVSSWSFCLFECFLQSFFVNYFHPSGRHF